MATTEEQEWIERLRVAYASDRDGDLAEARLALADRAREGAL